VGIRGIAGAHLVDGGGEQAVATEDAGVFGKEAENQARHEVVHVVTAQFGAPVGVFAEQFHVEAVQAAGGADVEGVFPDLLDRGDSGERQEKTEVIGEGRIIAGDRLAIDEVLGFKGFAVGGEDELGLLFVGGRAFPQGGERGSHLALRADLEVDVVALENAAGEVGLVGIATAKPL